MSEREIVTDVLVVGLGAAGIAASLTAYQAGAQVLAIDKAPYCHRGGNSRVSGQIIFWPNDLEKSQTYFKGMAGAYLDHISDAMVRVWAEEMHANRAWLCALGMEPVNVHSVEFPELPGSDCVEVLMHRPGPYGQARLWDEVLEPAFRKTHIEVHYETAALRLILAEGKVRGVLAAKGVERLRYVATRGVILTCGGFQNAPAMVRTFLSDVPSCRPLGTPYNTGDGIRMAMQVGAGLWHMNNLAGPNLGARLPHHPVATRLGPIRNGSYVYVGADGRRFVNEAPNFKMENGRQLSPIKHGKVLVNGRYVQHPCPVPIHMVFDEAVRTSGGLCGRAAGFQYGWDVLQDVYHWSSDNRQEIEAGWIKCANNLSELAQQISIAPETLLTTVADFNDACHRGLVDAHGRPLSERAPLETPPFYALELVPTMLNTQGGPIRNERGQIVDVFGTPLPGLYSAGELGSIYSYRYQAGANLAECFASGRVAGRNAAAESG